MKKQVLEKLNEMAKKAESLIKNIDDLKSLISESDFNIGVSDTPKSPEKKPRKLAIILAAGHGGMLNGQYMTNPIDGKKYTFTHVTPNETAYEGVLNRNIANAIHHKLIKAGFRVFKVYDPVKDLPLHEISAMENSIVKMLGKDEKPFYLSIHHNANGANQSGKGNSANGWCCFIFGNQTSYSQNGYTYATVIEKHQRKAIQDNKIDMGLRDGGFFYKQKQAIWTANFHELRETKSPAVLIEGGFFTNYKDFKIIDSDKWIDITSDAYVSAMIEIDSNM